MKGETGVHLRLRIQGTRNSFAQFLATLLPEIGATRDIRRKVAQQMDGLIMCAVLGGRLMVLNPGEGKFDTPLVVGRALKKLQLGKLVRFFDERFNIVVWNPRVF